MEIFLFWLIFSFVVGFVGSSRKIGFAGAFFASILLSPLIGLIITLVSKNKEEEAYKEQVLQVQKEQKETLNKLANTKSQKKENNSIIDDLKKLKDLRDSEVISEDEFKKLKSRIIDNTFEETIIEPEEPEIKETKIESETLNEEMSDNLENSKPAIRNSIIGIIMIVIIGVSLIFYIVSSVESNTTWRQPTINEEIKLNSIINEYEISCELYYVKKINGHKYFIAFLSDNSNWDYREIDTEKEKMYIFNYKDKQKLKPPK